METHNRKEAGDRGEQLALRHLQAAGLKLLLQNYRCRMGEIDLIMRDGDTLALIEVRYRSETQFGGAAASVNKSKQQRLIRAAQHLLQNHAAYRHYRARFDLVAIDGDDSAARITWIKDAFRL